ncbi:MAG: enoyl-CoA hydratase/isomerase family protein [Desulfuromonadaceae bacterium]|nr:enoyl-CoA hydratase/isomerase family protein [Desulfuromonadaceae bacterium]
MVEGIEEVALKGGAICSSPTMPPVTPPKDWEITEHFFYITRSNVMAYQYIIMTTEGRVLTISLNRPPTNPLNSEFGLELFKAFSEAEQMDNITVVVITSALEKVFIAGGDIKEMAAKDAADAEIFSKLLQGANNIINRMKKVVIAAINGHALGGGCELAMACDYRLMTSGKALIGLPEAGLGIIPGAGGTQRLPRLVGLSKALDILLRGKTMSPQEALAIGLVDQLIEPENFKEEVMKFATDLASAAGKALGNIKAAVYEGIDLPMEQALAVERKYVTDNGKTYDAREGLTAFVEKRKPLFLNK